MSIINSAKEFFGLAPVDMDNQDAYYDEPRYEGTSAYQPAYREPEVSPRRYPATIVTVELDDYSDATKIGSPFRDGDAVVFDLTRADKAVAKRVVDFAAGLCFALRGTMHKVADKVFAIIPEDADISLHELKRAARV